MDVLSSAIQPARHCPWTKKSTQMIMSIMAHLTRRPYIPGVCVCVCEREREREKLIIGEEGRSLADNLSISPLPRPSFSRKRAEGLFF